MVGCLQSCQESSKVRLKIFPLLMEKGQLDCGSAVTFNR